MKVPPPPPGTVVIRRGSLPDLPETGRYWHILKPMSKVSPLCGAVIATYGLQTSTLGEIKAGLCPWCYPWASQEKGMRR